MALKQPTLVITRGRGMPPIRHSVMPALMPLTDNDGRTLHNVSTLAHSWTPFLRA